MKRRTKWILGIVAVVVLAGVGAAVIQGNKPKGTRVRTTKVERKDLVSLVTANGTLEAETKVDLSANIMGQIVELTVEEGDRVRRGQLLLVIDPTRYAAAVESRRQGLQALEAELQRAREVAAQARRDWERADRQFRDEILPASMHDQARSTFEQAQSAVQTAERQVAQARADVTATRDELAKTEIRAPMDGIVTRRNVERGEVVVTGTMNNPGTVLMTISDMSSIEAVLEVDQTDVPRLRLGQQASVLIDAFPDRTFPGVVSEIGSSPIMGPSALGGTASGTDYEVKVRLANVPEGVRPGLTVTADVTTDTRRNVLTIPIGALVLRQEGGDDEPRAAGTGEEGEDGAEEELSTRVEDIDSVASRTRDVEGVYLVRAAGKNGGATAEFRAVGTGARGELDLEVVSGLEEGEEVIVGPFRALRELKPGDSVVVDNTQSAELEE